MLKAVFVSLSVFASAGCSLCSETELQHADSSRGERATVTIRDCGATTDFATVVRVGGYWKTDVVAVKGKEDLIPSWSSDGSELRVGIPGSVGRSDVFLKTTKVKGVRIVLQAL